MIRPAALLCAAVLGFGMQAQATAVAQGAKSSWDAASAGFTLRGAGTFRWLGLKIYDAELWTHGAPGAFTHPFALKLRYARNLKGAAIAERSIEEIEALGLGTPEKRRDWAIAMARLFPDVAKGSTLTGLHVPGRGARFFHDGKALGEIADPGFSQAFFSIWLDPQTSAPELRAALLAER